MKTFVAAALLAGVLGCGAAVWAQGWTGSAPAAPAGAATAQSATAAAPASAPASAFKTEKERIGYAIGLQVGSKLQGVDVDGAALAQGVRDAATGAAPKLTQEEIRTAIMSLQKELQDAGAAAVTANQKAGEKFLAENAKKDGVKTTATGLQYKVIKSGAGKSPKATDSVSVNYKGMLLSGKVFDQTEGTPVTLPVNHVIPGWTEALEMMKEGDKWTLYIPSKLAYGEDGAGNGAIGPNETLIFEVELVAVK